MLQVAGVNDDRAQRIRATLQTNTLHPRSIGWEREKHQSCGWSALPACRSKYGADCGRRRVVDTAADRIGEAGRQTAAVQGDKHGQKSLEIVLKDDEIANDL